MKFQLRLSFLFVVIGLSFWAGVALAQSSEPKPQSHFSYTRESRDLYEIVLSDEVGPKDERVPKGIYKIDSKTAKLVLLAPGNVTGVNRVYRGVLAYPWSQKQHQAAHDIMSVIDGKLVLLNHNTSPKNSNSLLRFGQAGPGGVPLVDLLNGNSIPLPEIKDVNTDVSIHEGSLIGSFGQFPKDARLYLVSIRAQTLLGDGLTFAFIMNGTGPTDKVSVFENRAIVIGYDFMTPEALARSIDQSVPGRPLIYSKLLIANTKMSLPSEVETKFIQLWGRQLDRFSAFLSQGKLPSSLAQDIALSRLSVPAYDFIHRRIHFEHVPYEPLSDKEGAMGIALGYDPNTKGFALLDLGNRNVTGFYSFSIGGGVLSVAPQTRVDESVITRQRVFRHSKTGKLAIVEASTTTPIKAAQGSGRPSDQLFTSSRDAFVFFDSQTKPYLSIRQLKGEQEYQILPMPFQGWSPFDQIEFVQLKTIQDEGRTIRTLLFSRRSERAKAGSVWSLVLEETTSVRIIHYEQIMDGPHLSPFELYLRTQYVEGSGLPVFDNITPTQGAITYLRDKKKKDGTEVKEVFDLSGGPDKFRSIKSTPYLRLIGPAYLSSKSLARQSHGRQIYLKSLSVVPMIAGELDFKEFDPFGSQTYATGFYLNPDYQESERFISGVPLFSRKEKGTDHPTHISDSLRLEFGFSSSDSAQALRLSLFPFGPQVVKSKRVPLDSKENLGSSTKSVKEQLKVAPPKAFSIGIAITPVVRASNSGNLTDLRQFDIKGLPYQALTFTKLIQGIKNSADQFHILLFFNEDPKVQGSINAVVLINGRISRDSLAKRQLQVNYSDPIILHRGPVSSTEYKAHLKVDAEGAMYWDGEPGLPVDSPKRKVWKMSDLNSLPTAKNTSSAALKDADHLRESDIGFGKASRRGGSWELFGRESVRAKVAGMSEIIDAISAGDWEFRHKDRDKEKEKKDEAKTKADAVAEGQVVEAFLKYLDQMAAMPSSEFSRIRVILVESSLKPKIRTALYRRLVEAQSPFSFRNNNLKFYYAAPNGDDVDVSDELRHIAAQNSTPGRKGLLIVESDLLKNNKVVSRTVDAEVPLPDDADRQLDDPRIRFKGEGVTTQSSFAALLVSGGTAKTAKGWKKQGSPAGKVPTLILATPQEWREIQIQGHNRADWEAGVYGGFQTEFDVLTASWTVWPPGTERTHDEIRALGRPNYNPEEMKVFPTLNSLLEDSARGRLKGRQTILLVPPELKPVVQKLILTRWATPEQGNSQPWSHANRQLALFKLGLKDMSQSTIQDNFRAMHGASGTRNAVFMSELETIERAGRPSNSSGRSFVLRDPLKVTKGLLDETDFEGRSKDNGSSDFVEVPLEEMTSDGLRQLLEDYGVQIEDLQSSVHEMEEEKEDRVADGAPASSILTGRIRRAKAELEQLQSDRDKVVSALENSPSIEGDTTRKSEVRHFPHMLWWIAAEGRALQPKRQKGWNLRDAVERTASTILIGTEEELARLEAEMSPEARFFNIREHFNVVKLTPPSEATKVALVKSLFERDEVRSMQLQFETPNTGHGTQNHLEQLIYHFINRVDQIAYDLKIEKTTAFVKAFTVLKSQLVEDMDLRRNRRVDPRFIERLFTRVFPMPLNPEILEPNDPLRRLSKVDDAIRGLTTKGYQGSSELKRRFIENSLAQTRPTDSSRPIPNSQILFGKTSKGKTFLIQTLFSYLDLVEYVPNKANNADADYIFINVAKLTSEHSNDPEKVGVDKMIEYVSDLLSQPKGARAHIIFDDFHKAVSIEVRTKLFQFIQSLFEAKNGMFTVRNRSSGKTKEIPVQNLNLYMTLNPATNEKVRAEYIHPGRVYTPPELLKREVLAGISDQGFRPEESVLARWADIINIDNFPRSAKVPELARRVRQGLRSNRSLVLVDPQVIGALVSAFDNANAREILSTAATALTGIPSAASPAQIYLVSMKPRVSGAGVVGNDVQVNLQEIQSEVRRLTQIDPVTLDRPRTFYNMMGYIMQNFRTQVINGLALQAHMTDVLKINKTGMQNVLKNAFLSAVATHGLRYPILPQSLLTIQPQQLSFYSSVQAEEFFAAHKPVTTQDYFPRNFGRTYNVELDLGRFLDGRHGDMVILKGRQEVVNEFVGKVESVLVEVLSQFLRTSEADLQRGARLTKADIDNWFAHLSDKNPDQETQQMMYRLLELFTDFRLAFAQAEIRENSVTPTFYDEARLFTFILDKAITRLPWVAATKMTYDIVEASSDMRLGMKPAFKEYLGTHELSPFNGSTVEFLTDVLVLSNSKLAPAEYTSFVSRAHQQFMDKCQNLLTRGEN